MPARGETVSGGTFVRAFGGKGANQAAAAARLGGTVALVACVGDDDFGRAARIDLERAGVDCRWLQTHAGVATGTALINVDAAGGNTITVAPGANRLLDVARIEAAIEAVDADVLIAGFEIGADAALTALQSGGARGMRTICNPSPVDAGAISCFASSSTVVVNEVEARAYGGTAAILTAGAGDAVLTLGAAGAQRHQAAGIEHMEAFPVTAVDTTGAGDAFCAALAVFDDLRFACAAGALACRAVGARAAQPTNAEIEALLKGPPRSHPG